MANENIKIDDTENKPATPPMGATICEISIPPLQSLRHCQSYYLNLVELARSPEPDPPTTYDIPSYSYIPLSSSDTNDSGSDADLDSDTGTETSKPR